MNPLPSSVRARSYDRQHAIRIARAIELMPMDHEHLAAVGGLMNQRTTGVDRAEDFFDQADPRLVMMPRQEYYVGAAAAPSPNLIHHFLLLGTPVPRRSPVPAVDYVADQVKGLRNVTPQKIE